MHSADPTTASPKGSTTADTANTNEYAVCSCVSPHTSRLTRSTGADSAADMLGMCVTAPVTGLARMPTMRTPSAARRCSSLPTYGGASVVYRWI